MTVSEFLFLAFGLVLGLASGVALIEIIRARPPARREVRVTVAQDAIPRRASTLADDAFVLNVAEPARGGPADRRATPTSAPAGAPAGAHATAPDRRTNVLNSIRKGPPSHRATGGSRVVGMPVAAGSDPMLGALTGGGRPATAPMVASSPGKQAAVALMDPPTAAPRAATAAGPAPTTAPPSAAGQDASGQEAGAPAVERTYTGPCADERRLADERCELATRAQTQAVAAADALRLAQRAYDTHSAGVAEAAEAASPRAVRSRKEDVQREFRAASKAASSPEAVEAAARTWLHEINRINREVASASMAAEREREAAAAVGATLERLGLEADAARIGAEMAHAACISARTAVAECDERVATGQPPAAAAAMGTPERAAPETAPGSPAARERLELALAGGGDPRVFRLLRGDPTAMDELVAAIAGDDTEAAGRWKLHFAGLLDAILADAIEQAYLRFPQEHFFWGPNTHEQNRDIARALASLGFRFDGLGGWVDDRLPSQRELSLAFGYAGLDPMRIRHWPTEEETGALFHDVQAASDEYLAGAAGELSLAEMVEMLGRRADGLVELWNSWGRIRPLLLEET